MPETASLTYLANEIRASDAVILLGAGASCDAGMPLAGQLPPLVWHTLDQHPAVRERVAAALGAVDAAAKLLIGDDVEAVRLGFASIGADFAARRTFQEAFANLDRDRRHQPSEAHDALARLVFSGHAQRVISLNWDTLLEAAFERQYGVGINAQGRVLWKPHGDCSRLDSSWVLPSEDGHIPDEVLADVEQLVKERPRVLLIVGYAGLDDVVVRRLVEPLARRWRVFWLSPVAVGDGAIQLTATDGLHGLAATLCKDGRSTGWEYVSFANQRGLVAAVSGERLGPKDVECCPRLPHFLSARQALDLLNFVDIAGPPGCGKSITAWQLARERNVGGWLVLRSSSARSSNQAWLSAALRNERWKKVIVVDDAQAAGDEFVSRLKGLVGSRLAVITATTDARSEQSRSVRIPAQAAVEALASEFRRRRDEVLPIVQRHDSRVGDRFLDTPFEWRLDEAAKGGTPWEFAFVLRGGWSRALEQLRLLRDFERADLALVLIAARQLLSCDVGVDLETLVSDAASLGRPRTWVVSSIETLRRQETLLPGLPLRCLHIRTAIVVIETALKTREEDSFGPLVSVLRGMVSAPQASVRGIGWLNEHVLGAHAFLYGRKDQSFYDAESLEALLQRLLKSRGAIARRDAAFVLGRLLWHQQLDRARLRAEFRELRTWLANATGVDCYALGSLLNYVGSKAPDDELARLMDPSTVWQQLARIEPSAAYSWGYFLGRLAFAGGAEWRGQVAALADRPTLVKLFQGLPVTDIEGISELALGLASFDPAIGMECLRSALPQLREAYASDPLAAYRATCDLEHRLLGHPLFGPARPSLAQRTLSREMTEAIRPEAIASGIVACRLGDWEMYARLLYFVRQANGRKHRAIVAGVPWGALEKRFEPHWRLMPREARLLLSSLADARTGEPVRTWILQHSRLMEEIDPIVAAISPEAAIALTKRGGQVNLAGHNRSDWRLQARALAKVAEVDANAARAILRGNEGHIATGLSSAQAIDVEEFADFIALARELDPECWHAVLRRVDLLAAREHWQRVVTDERPETRRQARRMLRCLIRDDGGPTTDLARAVLKVRHRRPGPVAQSSR